MTLHTKLSYVKSAARMVGYAGLVTDWLLYAVVVLILAEVVGIVEELPGSYKGTQTGEKK